MGEKSRNARATRKKCNSLKGAGYRTAPFACLWRVHDAPDRVCLSFMEQPRLDHPEFALICLAHNPIRETCAQSAAAAFYVVRAPTFRAPAARHRCRGQLAYCQEATEVLGLLKQFPALNAPKVSATAQATFQQGALKRSPWCFVGQLWTVLLPSAAHDPFARRLPLKS